MCTCALLRLDTIVTVNFLDVSEKDKKDMDGDQEESDHPHQDDLNPLAFLGLQR